MAGTLFERDRETAVIGELLDAAAQAGEPGLALIEGPAGAGKSRLLEVARDGALERGLPLLSARAIELERAFAFGLARQLVEPLLASASAQERERLLAGPAGLAASLLDGDADTAAIPFGDDHRHALAHGLRWLLANAGQPRPCVALVDDAHWADEPSLAFLAALGARLDLPLVLVVALRPGEPGAAEELLERLRGAPGARLLRPAPLGPQAISRLVAERLPAPDPAFVAACATATGGNPFLLVELLAAAAADLVEPTAAAASQVRALVPETVLRAMLLRLRRLPPEATAVARATAVLDERAPLARVAALAEITPAAAATAADALAATHLLAPGEPLRFVHPLVADAVRADVPAHALARLHGRAAELLATGGEPPEAVAAHLLHAPAGAWDGAGAALVAGARAALHRGDFATGQRLLARALEEPLPPRERADAEIATAFAEVARGAPGAPGVMPRIDAALRHVHEPERRAEAHLAVALHAYMRSEYELTLDAIARGLDELDPRGDGAIALRDLRTAALALAPGRIGERAALGDALDPAAARTRGSGGPAAAASAAGAAADRTAAGPAAAPDAALAARSPITVAVLAAAAATRGAPPGEVRALTDRVPLDRLAHDVLAGSIAASFAVTALIWSDELEAAERILAVALPAARDAGSLTAFGSLSHLRSLVRLRQGRLPEAIADAQPPLELRRDGWETYRSWTAARLAQAHVERGELEQAATLVRLGGDGAPDQLEHAFVLEAAGDLALARGDAAGALAQQLAAGRQVQRWELRHPGAVTWQANAALAAHRAGDAAQAATLAQAALERAREVGAPRALARALRAVAAVHGDAAGPAAAGASDAAASRARDASGPDPLAALHEAIELLRPTALRLELAYALVDLGAALRRRGEARGARGPLREGLALAEQCTAAPLAQRAHEELRATGGRRVRARPLDGPEALTPTEQRVAALAAAGGSNAEIAAQLFVTVKTVEWHLGRSYRKLGIASRRELAQALAA